MTIFDLMGLGRRFRDSEHTAQDLVKYLSLDSQEQYWFDRGYRSEIGTNDIQTFIRSRYANTQTS